MIFKKPTYDELRFTFTTSQLKEYAKRIGLDLGQETKKHIIASKIYRCITPHRSSDKGET